MGTIHANSARQALSKLQIYMLSGGEPITPDLAARIVAETINLIVHLKFVHSTQRAVAQIAEVAGIEGGQVLTNDLFKTDRGRLIATGLRCRSLSQNDGVPAESALPASLNGHGG